MLRLLKIIYYKAVLKEAIIKKNELAIKFCKIKLNKLLK